MFVLTSLIKEPKYFFAVRTMIIYVREIGTLTNRIFSADPPDKSLIPEINQLQHKLNKLYSEIVRGLNTIFITPIFREDVFALIKRIRSIGKMLTGASVRIDTFNVQRKIIYSDTISEIILKQIITLEDILQDLQEKIVDGKKVIRQLGAEANRIHRQALLYIFSEITDAIEIIKEKEILKIFGNTSDKCASLANVIMSVYIKNY